MSAVDEDAISLEEPQEGGKVPSLNHSYVCFQILRQLLRDDEIYALPELSLDIATGLTPDISVYRKDGIHPDFFHDVLKYPKVPILAVEVISPSQTIQSLLNRARMLTMAGVQAVWTVEPFSRSVFVTTPDGERLYGAEPVQSEGIRVDFSQVFR